MTQSEFILNFKIISSEFNKLLNEWDFLDAIDEEHPNEYEDLINPFLKQLSAGTEEKKLAIFIENHITERYGCTPDGDIFAKRMLHWWSEIDQRIICRKYSAVFTPSLKNDKIGISKNIKENIYPINGLRHRQENGSCGWYIWRDESFSQKSDFFEPIHVSHLEKYCPEIINFLGLPPGYRFLIDPTKNHIDVWFDEKLLDIE